MKFFDNIHFESYSLKSRIHSLKKLSDIYLKRDDELCGMISGSKIRKYASLIPYLKSLYLKKIGLIGGAYSNNIVGLSQLLLENGIQPVLFLRKPANLNVRGNFLLIQLLVQESCIHMIERQDWARIDEIVKDYGLYVVPEGAYLLESLPGAMTLSKDIQRNEREHEIGFNHIFIDAGTGLQAIGLILGHGMSKSQSIIHVIQLAPSNFEENLLYFKQKLRSQWNIPDFICNYKLWQPQNAPSFGSVNKKILNKISSFAKEEGVILDPIYSAKLIIESERIIDENQLKGKKLMVHSGGAVSLFGYY